LATQQVRERTVFEATDPRLSAYWQGVFPDEVPARPVVPELLDSGLIELEGRELRVISIGQGDTEHSTILHVPEIDAVVAGDVVYNQVHMMIGEADAAARAAWIASLDAIETLAPQIVVSGHKRVGAPDRAITIEQSREYLRDFSRVAQEHETVEEIVKAMLALHRERDNPRVVWHSARIEVARRSTT
jgi:glyoxylase-like metal-dependent hydrolase (beta-lactamase superfamily II)